MPWTFAHPAAILPLRRRLPLAALVVGSLSPDIGYYLGLYVLATFAHSAWGLLQACLPIGAATLVALHLLREPVLDLLPEPHRSALRHARASCATAPTGPRRLVLAVAGLLAGAATHNAWDAFTHASCVGRAPGADQAMSALTATG